MDKEWEVEASIEIKTSFWCETKVGKRIKYRKSDIDRLQKG